MTSRFRLIQYATVLTTIMLIGFLKKELFFLPHYWDDLWVYGPAIVDMSQKLSILPGSLPLELGRGHPLLFHFLGGLWVALFGTSLFAQHLFPFFIYSITVVAFSELLKALKVQPTLIIAGTVLFASHPYLLAQSTLVLPELLLTFSTILLLTSVLKRKIALIITSSVICALTKETGVVIVFVSLVGAFVFNCIQNRKIEYDYLLSGIPAAIVFGVFLLLNFSEYGWFFYPEHIALQSSSVEVIRSNIKGAVENLITYEYFEIFSFIFLGLLIAKHKFHWKALISFPIFILLFKFIVGRMKIHFSLDLIGTLFSVVLVIYLLNPSMFSSGNSYTQKCRNQFLFISLLLITVYLSFFSFNFSSIRYLTLIIPIIVSGFIIVIDGIQKHVAIISSIAAIVVFILNTFQDERILDITNNWSKEVACRQEAVHYVISENMDSVKTDFLTYYALKYPNAGYIDIKEPNTRFVTNLESDLNIPEVRVLNQGTSCRFEFDK